MKMVLKQKKEELPGVRSFIFEPQQPLSWQPGQYMHYVLPHPDKDDRGVERFFTIASAPFEKRIQITTRLTDPKGSSFKKALDNLSVGQEIEADGPRGQFTFQPDFSRHIFIAGGIGITPFRSILNQLNHEQKPIPVELFYANRDDNLVFGSELRELEATHPELHIRPFIGEKRIAEEDFRSFVDDNHSLFYISGPRPLVENYQHMLEAMGVGEDRIKLDYFPGY
jgi:glycine betaine catabolism B